MKDGKYYSKKFGCEVWLEEKTFECFYDVCSRCGKPLKNKVYSITPDSDGIEYLYGRECIKSLRLTKI